MTKKDNVGKLVLRCAAAGVAVYSPHTGCDAAVNGVNDWLCCAFFNGGLRPDGGGMVAGKVEPAQPTTLQPWADSGAGEGRVVKFAAPLPLDQVVTNIKAWLKVRAPCPPPLPPPVGRCRLNHWIGVGLTCCARAAVGGAGGARLRQVRGWVCGKRPAAAKLRDGWVRRGLCRCGCDGLVAPCGWMEMLTQRLCGRQVPVALCWAGSRPMFG